MKKYLFSFLFVMACCFSASAQKEMVTFKSRAAMPLRSFEYHQPSSFEIVNGKFNAALGSANGYLFEITGIAVKSLKCDAKLSGNSFKVVLIDNSMNRTYVSLNDGKGSLTIHCLPNGNYELFYTGEVFREKQKVNITATLSGSVHHSKDLKTNR